MKDRIRGVRAAAARFVNHELISLYWDLGKAIALKRASAGWGDAVVEKLSHKTVSHECFMCTAQPRKNRKSGAIQFPRGHCLLPGK